MNERQMDDLVEQNDELELEIAAVEDEIDQTVMELSGEQKPVLQEEEEPTKKESKSSLEQRIAKLTYQRREAERQLAEGRKQLDAMHKRLATLEQGAENRVVDEFNQAYIQTEAALAKAAEEGDTNAQIKLLGKMTDLRVAARLADAERRAQQNAPRQQPVQAQGVSGQSEVPQLAMKWWQENVWFNKPEFSQETRIARAIDQQLDLMGLDKNSEEYYVELDRRLAEALPDLKKAPATRVKKQSPVAPVSSGTSGGSKKITLSREQMAIAQELGINDAEGLKAYAREIQAAQAR